MCLSAAMCLQQPRDLEDSRFLGQRLGTMSVLPSRCTCLLALHPGTAPFGQLSHSLASSCSIHLGIVWYLTLCSVLLQTLPATHVGSTGKFQAAPETSRPLLQHRKRPGQGHCPVSTRLSSPRCSLTCRGLGEAPSNLADSLTSLLPDNSEVLCG